MDSKERRERLRSYGSALLVTAGLMIVGIMIIFILDPTDGFYRIALLACAVVAIAGFAIRRRHREPTSGA